MNIWIETGLFAVVALVFLFFFTKLCVSSLIYIASRKSKLIKSVGGFVVFLLFSGFFASLMIYMNYIAEDYPEQKGEIGYAAFKMVCFLFSVFPVFWYVFRVKIRDLQSHGYFVNK